MSIASKCRDLNILLIYFLYNTGPIFEVCNSKLQYWTMILQSKCLDLMYPMSQLFDSYISASTRGEVLTIATCCLSTCCSGFFDIPLPLCLIGCRLLGSCHEMRAYRRMVSNAIGWSQPQGQQLPEQVYRAHRACQGTRLGKRNLILYGYD